MHTRARNTHTDSCARTRTTFKADPRESSAVFLLVISNNPNGSGTGESDERVHMKVSIRIISTRKTLWSWRLKNISQLWALSRGNFNSASSVPHCGWGRERLRKIEGDEKHRDRKGGRRERERNTVNLFFHLNIYKTKESRVWEEKKNGTRTASLMFHLNQRTKICNWPNFDCPVFFA